MESRLNSELQFNFEEYVNSDIDEKYYDELVFDGTNYINTGIKLFSEENINRNFEVYFEIDEFVSPYNSQGTILNVMREVSPYPGFVFRHMTNDKQLEFNSPSLVNKTLNINNVKKVYIKRYNDIYYIRINDDNIIELGKSKNQTTFDTPATFGASLDKDGNPWRFFKGKLSNVYIKLFDSEKYIVKYDSNGGTGSMDDQEVRIDDTVSLLDNRFERDDYVFDGWNTKADGTGKKYTENENIKNIAKSGETITLYAVWIKNLSYVVNYNSNGGTGIMQQQEFNYGESQEIKNNEFTKENSVFLKWNTKADGTGVDYRPGQSVKNLTQVDNDVFEVYAIWANKSYVYDGEYKFNGDNYINTGVYLFADPTINMDFEISFDIVSHDKYDFQATLFSCMDESASPWPGILYRIKDSSNDQIAANSNNSLKFEKNYLSADIVNVSIKRTNGVIYVSFNGSEYEQIQDMTSIIHTFEVPLTFGSSLNSSGSPFRYFKGTLKSMKVFLYD